MKQRLIFVGIILILILSIFALNLGSEESIVQHNEVGSHNATSKDKIMNQRDVSDQQKTNKTQSKNGLILEKRSGEAPGVTDGIPHVQLDQVSDDTMYDKLIDQTYQIEGIVDKLSTISFPGTRSLAVDESLTLNPQGIITDREFAHIHADPGRGSLHLVLSESDAAAVVDMSWGVYHPFALEGRVPGMVMVFSPRDDKDLGVVMNIIKASFKFATNI